MTSSDTSSGLIGGTVLTLVTAFSIGANGGPYAGVIPGPADPMVLSGWMMVIGHLSLSHFLATRMIHSVPAAAMVVPALALGPARGWLLDAFVALLWTLLTIKAFHRVSRRIFWSTGDIPLYLNKVIVIHNSNYQ